MTPAEGGAPGGSPSGFVGGGVGYRHPYRAALLDEESAPRPALPALLEIMPDHFFASPAALEPLAERYPLVLHDVGLSPGTWPDESARAIEERRLERVRDLVRRARPLLISDHLALTRSPAGRDLGHLAPLRYTRALLEHLAARLAWLQDRLGAPLALENIAAPFLLPGDFDEPAFFHRLVERTGCGVLLDLSNLVVNGRNFDFDPRVRLPDYPLGSVMQVHLAGARRDGGDPRLWVDSHDGPVSEESFALLAALRGRAPLRAVIVERDDRLPPLGELCAEAARAARVFTGGEETAGQRAEVRR